MRILTTLAATAAFALLATATGLAAGKAHKLAIHVDQNDPAIMNLALNNAQNVKSFYEAEGDTVTIEIVAYGPGLTMYTADSPVKARIATMSLEDPDMQFSACGNTLKKMSEKAGKDIPLLSEATLVPSGVVRLMELQEDGFSYVRP